MCAALLSLLTWLDESQLEKMLINLEPEGNSSLKELNEGRIPLILLLASTIDPLIFNY